MPEKYRLLLLFLAFALGLGIRLWCFGKIPVGVNQDGAMAAVDGKALADHATDRFGTHLPAHLYAWGYGQMSSLLSYLIAFWVKLFGLSTVTMRLPQLIASILGGVFFYLFASDVFGRRVGLIAAFIVAINPWHFVQSRWALDCNLLPHFLMCGIWLLRKGAEGKKIYLYLSMIIFGLCMYCYGIALYTVPLMLLLSCVLLIRQGYVTVKEAIACALIYLAVVWPFILTMAINFFGLETVELPFVTCQRFADSVRSSDILFFSNHFFSQLTDNILSFLKVALFQRRDLPWNEIPLFGSMYIFSHPLVLLGLVRLIRLCKAGSLGSRLALILLLNGVWTGIATNGVNINRVNSVFYPIMLLCVLGIEAVFERSKALSLSVILAYGISAVLMVGTYFGSYSASLAHYFYDGFGEALLAAEDTGADVICISDSVQCTDSKNVSEILTLFYDETDAEYFQGKTDNNKGKELLSYKDRFKYIRIGESTAEMFSSKKSVFVVKNSEKKYFSGSGFEILSFGDYCAVIPI